MKRSLILFLIGFTSLSTHAADPLDLGDRRELFVDDHLIDSSEGVALTLHPPEAREVVLVCDAPWEGNTSAYFTLIEDDGLFRCYYRGSHYDEVAKKGTHVETTCYAESRDGIVWTKPKLGLVEFEGSKENNVLLAGAGCHNFTPFLDTRPDCPPESRYKALAGTGDNGTRKKRPSLQAWHSPDGLRWTRMREEPVISEGAFDSKNLAFYDAARGEYRAYWRYFTGGYTDERGWKPSGVRAIRTAVSKDFLEWTGQADLAYGEAPPEQLYTNAIRPYPRAPHLFVGFPTRYEAKQQQVEPILMTSRDAVNFRRWDEAPLIPITAPEDRDGNRSNYMANGMLRLPGREGELSVYATEAYYAGPGSRLRRFAFRLDGFASATAKGRGVILTKPLTFSGSTLSLNLVSRGESRIELVDADGQAIPGFALADCAPVSGDHLDQPVSWKGGSLAPLAGRTVRLRFDLRDADLYAFQIQP